MALQKNPRIYDFEPPSKKLYESITRFPRFYFKTRFFGEENVPANQAVMAVGNHTLFAMLDAPLIVNQLYQNHDLYLRGLGDHMNFEAPGWRNIAEKFGMVEGLPEYCEALLESGQSILLYPGGAREVCKRKGEENTTVWKQRTGFARIAMKTGTPILPFASYGPDNTADILFDAVDFQESKLGQKLLSIPRVSKRLRGGDVFFPVTRGIPFTPLLKPVPFYISFGEPVETAAYQNDWDNKDAQWEVRHKVQSQVDRMLSRMEEISESEQPSKLRQFFIG